MTEFVSLPSLDPQKPSPHLTGGSVDLTIATLDGLYLDMGTPFDDFSERAHTAFYNDKGGDSPANRNRELLYSCLTSVGFTNYPSEWWHYDYGNQFWGSATGSNAIYGLIDSSMS